MRVLACALEQEAEYIARYEHFREPLLSDERVALAVDEEDDAAKYDVYRSSEEGGRDEDEKRLHDEGSEGPQVVV